MVADTGSILGGTEPAHRGSRRFRTAALFALALVAGALLLVQMNGRTTLAAPVEDPAADEAFNLQSHEASEGPLLGANTAEHIAQALPAASCPEGVTTKRYDIAAIRVDITLNRWGDHDPEGYMYASVEQLDAIRAQEAAGEAENFGLSLGLAGDAIQPLSIRANVGDCLVVALRNDLDEPTSFFVHGADLVLADGSPALTSNPDAIAMPGETVVYQWHIAEGFYDENTHYAHPHGAKDRYQVSHGLFGAVMVEPAGSEYFDQRTGESLCGDGAVSQCRNSWDAMISPGDGTSDFREFVMVYHEVGNERFSVFDKNDDPLPIIDPQVNSYKPNGRAINYRSESFMRRMGEIEEQVDFYQNWKPDEAEAYSSSTFGEPAMPVPQSYVGDPAKFRIVHGGSETFHVPHLHGGGIQWQRQQDITDESFTSVDAGLKKDFDNRMSSSGNDSQTIGPSETYELEIGCGSGGCQQTAGDFLFHCHVASHYISGMWHFWRTYNTLQDEAGKTDDLAAVVELPDRQGTTQRAVEAPDLLGTQVNFTGSPMTVSEQLLPALVQAQLPPAGKPNDEQDASVMDWERDGLQFYGQPETEYSWPNYTPQRPGERSPLRFDPVTGKLAFPFLRPQLGSRPPFAPDHGPAPYLEPLKLNSDPAVPGANGADSLCPEGAPVRSYNIHAISTSIPVNNNLTDDQGMIFVLKENEELARSNPDYKWPLAVRANQGDCVDVFFVNELEPLEEGAKPDLMKTNIHIHFVQFDVLASDGVISGANYEQAVRPFTAEGLSAEMTTPASAGDRRITVSDPDLFHVGAVVAVGIDAASDLVETREVTGIDGNDLMFRRPLRNDHAAGDLVSSEFVRYRWYVARQNGAIYFHDHVDALRRWGHGLFGALIAEPEGSTYHDPRSGEEILSGPYADIHTEGEVLPGLEGSFREAVLFMNDRNPLTGSSFNLRAEPLHADTARGSGPPELALSSALHGDPATPVIRAYAGDPVIFRLLTSATEEVHPFHITGHTFRQERFQEESPGLTVFGVGISERFNAYVESAGGPAQRAGDYLYYNGAQRHFMSGAWGIFRVHDTAQDDLQALPGREPPAGEGFPADTTAGAAPAEAEAPGDPCPADAPTRRFDVTALDVPLVFNQDAGSVLTTGRIYVLDQNVEAVKSRGVRPQPLVIRANAGECVSVGLTNNSSQPVSFHLDALGSDGATSLGINVGYNQLQTAAVGGSREYRYYAQAELGTVLIRDFGNPFRNGRDGLYGALIVEPPGSTYADPYTGEAIDSGVNAVIRVPGEADFREFVTIFHDSDPDIGLFVMPYDEEVNKLVGVNYAAEPMVLRLLEIGVLADGDDVPEENQELAAAIFDSDVFWDPATDIFEAFGGDRVVFRIVSGYSEQNSVFSVEGHQWQLTPTLTGSDVVSSRYLPPTGVLNAEIDSAGGPNARAGDYVWGNHRLPYQKAGQWGFLRVLEPGADTDLLPLSDR